jgi:hypothetical protein
MNSNPTYPKTTNTTNMPTARQKRLRNLPTKQRIAQGARKTMGIKLLMVVFMRFSIYKHSGPWTALLL